MEDFIFGTLANDALRLEHVRRLRAGVTHHSRRAPRDPAVGQPIKLELTVGPAHPCSQAWVYWSTDGVDPEGSNGVAKHGWATPLEAFGTEWDTLLWGYVRRYQVTLPGQPAGTVLRYRLSVSAETALPETDLPPESSVSCEIFADQGACYAVYVDDDPLPDWTRDAVVYQIFVDRFSPGAGRNWLHPETPAGFYGGTLRGVTQKLDYIARLGANVLWLTPIFPSPSHHGYDAMDLFEIEPRLGTKQDLSELLEAAHARGMRVLLDFVPNHVSNLHPSFQAALNDPNSPFVDWYTFRHWPDEYESFFGVQSLPQINLRHPAARQHMLDAAAYWLELGVDGYRVDYAIGPTPDFWADFRRVTRSVRPDCWTFGEVVEPPDSQIAFEGLLDGCLDFMLLEALRQTCAFGRWDAVRLSDFLERHEAFFRTDFSRPSFLDNHDMNRFLWTVQGDTRRLKIAALCQFTLSGPPVIYYGTEVGLSQERDVRQGQRGLPEEARLPMLWGKAQDSDLLAFYRDLIALRRELAPGRQPRQNWPVGEGILAYTTGKAAMTVINPSDQPRTMALTGPWNRLRFASQADCRLSAAGGSTRLELPPLSGAVLSLP